ncbi:lachesin, partial [Condylostylus longicornis]|uniref:lachesin n=1 Tax=Condylostylus longicornis TaxID=2530218 RepID=UPI00244E06B8
MLMMTSLTINFAVLKGLRWLPYSNLDLKCSLLLGLLLFNYIVAAFEPDFVFPLENVTVAQGRDATFTCVVNNLGGHRVSGGSAQQRINLEQYEVAWIKADAKAILAIHEHVISSADRLTVTHNDYNTWTLLIRNVRMEDAGQYMCQVNTDPMKMQTAYLQVVIPPDIINEETSGDMMVPEGGSAKMICKARGFPTPKITWRREDGREIIARNGPHGKTKALAVEGEMLWLSKVTRSEMGAYLCIASNGVPPSVSKRMKLQVHFHPLVQVPNQLVGAPVGTDVTLICNVEASPKAINYWQRENGEMIIPGERYIIDEKDISMYAAEMTLQIKRLQKTDFGGYKCISKNSIGDTEGTIRLYEMEVPGRKKSNGDEDDHSFENVDEIDNGNLLDESYTRDKNRVHKGSHRGDTDFRHSSSNSGSTSLYSNSLIFQATRKFKWILNEIELRAYLLLQMMSLCSLISSIPTILLGVYKFSDISKLLSSFRFLWFAIPLISLLLLSLLIVASSLLFLSLSNITVNQNRFMLFEIDK